MVADGEIVGEELEAVGGYERLPGSYAVDVIVDHSDCCVFAGVVDNLHLFNHEWLALYDIDCVVVNNTARQGGLHADIRHLVVVIA